MTIVETYRNDFDARALPYLRPWLSRTGCGGFFKTTDCWPCLHDARFLDTVVKEIEDRTKALK